jgi:hypothetical protein
VTKAAQDTLPVSLPQSTVPQSTVPQSTVPQGTRAPPSELAVRRGTREPRSGRRVTRPKAALISSSCHA